jgi:hypothetical protein
MLELLEFRVAELVQGGERAVSPRGWCAIWTPKSA